jgi:hypothetical protein
MQLEVSSILYELQGTKIPVIPVQVKELVDYAIMFGNPREHVQLIANSISRTERRRCFNVSL